MTPRMRTIQEAAAELRRIDPHTAVTPYFIRRMVLSGAIPHVKAGNKRLVNLDTLRRPVQDERAEGKKRKKGLLQNDSFCSNPL